MVVLCILKFLKFLWIWPFSSCRSGWNQLQELIQSRQKKLEGAHEIHKFSRDAREILGRLKVATIPHKHVITPQQKSL